MSKSTLTAAQEDYLEAIQRIAETGDDVRITQLAAWLGCKLPTVTRTVKRIVNLGLVAHESRGTVHLTRSGRAAARHLVHRHEDLVKFLNLVLGLSPERAEADACQLEHGMSPLATQRLHQWLQHLEGISRSERARVLEFPERENLDLPDFDALPSGRTSGWRG